VIVPASMNVANEAFSAIGRGLWMVSAGCGEGGAVGCGHQQTVADNIIGESSEKQERVHCLT
jgi:hypothetical protein